MTALVVPHMTAPVAPVTEGLPAVSVLVPVFANSLINERCVR